MAICEVRAHGVLVLDEVHQLFVPVVHIVLLCFQCATVVTPLFLVVLDMKRYVLIILAFPVADIVEIL